ncbi:MAG TPA: isocitrate lyase/phosphoenolpyruvate mutase family protein [Myxococcaceae bacterium]|jgi:2-methylisocitrate lyase-like PEP mutase family enzyme
MAPTPAVAAFRALHESGCFVLPNPWDTGTARYLKHLGFRALASTSAGFGYARGLPDSVTAIPCEAMLAHVAELAAATDLPVNADFQNGYADEPEGVAANVARCVRTGAAGLSIEDSSGSGASPLYERGPAIERVRAARAAIDASGSGVVLTARCEAWLVGHPEPGREALDRLVAFADAGADCLYAPGVRDPAIIAELVRAVAPRPLNVLVSSPSPELTVARLAALGVRRISVGSALARVAWGAFMRAAKGIQETGTFDGLAGLASFAELNQIFDAQGGTGWPKTSRS